MIINLMLNSVSSLPFPKNVPHIFLFLNLDISLIPNKSKMYVQNNFQQL